jgi:hypothetical protein
VVANGRERLAVSKQAAHNSEAEWFNLRKINGLEVRKGNRIKVSNRFAALENLHDNEEVNRSWENIKENIIISTKESLGLYELKQYKTRFDEEWLSFLDQGKQAKMQWLQYPNQINVDNLNNIRREGMSES